MKNVFDALLQSDEVGIRGRNGLDLYGDLRRGEKGAWLSLVVYIVFAAAKIGFGLAAGSKALMADGMNNLSDIIVSVAVLIGIRIARKPPDDDPPYGHLRAETIAALVASVLMMGVAVDVLRGAVASLFGGEVQAPDWRAVWIALIGATGMYGVYVYNRNLAAKTNNAALMAAAMDNRADAFVSVGAAAGVLGAQWGLPWLDPLAAIAVSVLIGKTAWDIFSRSAHALTDGFDDRQLERLRDSAGKAPGVRKIKDIRARAYGSRIMLDVIVEVDPHLNVVESHAISDDIEKRLKGKYNIMDVHVHIEPAKTE